MERNAIFATILVIMILVGYQWYLAQLEAPAPPQPSKPPETAPLNPPTPAPPPAAPTAPVPTPAPRAKLAAPREFIPTASLGLSPKDVTVKTPLLQVKVSTGGARVTSWELLKYHTDSGAPVNLVASSPAGGPSGTLATSIDAEPMQGVFQVDRDEVDLTGGQETGTLTFTYVAASGVQVQKRMTFRRDSYGVEVGLDLKNLSKDNVTVEPRLTWGPGFHNSHARNATTLQPPTVWLDGKRVQEDISKLSGERDIRGVVSWVALQDQYFAAALLPLAKDAWAFVQKAVDDQPVVGLAAASRALPAGGELSIGAIVFGGPKDLDALKAVGHGLDQIVDLGMFDRIYLVTAALWLLKTLNRFTGNYGLAIILVTILQKIAFYPLTTKSVRSMQAMQAIQPKVQAIQERFKNNPQKKQEETMALYRKHGVNPMGGCLPMLVQIPIFIALYNALSSSPAMWQAHFLWIRDLTQPDSLFTVTLWGGHAYPFNLLGLLMGASMWLQQKMSPPAGDPRQAQMMLWMMPILFTFMFWSFPSGLVLYWLVNNLLQIGQQWLIMRKPTRPAPEGQPA
jgi:YidC/Oxa1 family membrane protein insertase